MSDAPATLAEIDAMARQLRAVLAAAERLADELVKAGAFVSFRKEGGDVLEVEISMEIGE